MTKKADKEVTKETDKDVTKETDREVTKETDREVTKEVTSAGKKRDPLLGTEVAGRYELLSLLGRGATTSVYKANDKEKGRIVAVKILRTDSIFNEQLIRRFEQECKTLALLKHKNIVELYDSGINDTDQPFLVMEFVDGSSLKDLIEADDRLDVRRVLKIFVQICAALAVAHEKGIVHRDMKPANIMLTRDSGGEELVKILDFGVAKLLVQGETFQTKTQTGEMLGTLLYMSPEQCLEQVLDERCDVYSVGCVLYEALTGTPPLIGRTAFETMNKHLTQMPEKLSKVRPDRRFDRRLDAVLQIAMAKDAKNRYQTIGEFQSALSTILVNIDERATATPVEEANVVDNDSETGQVAALHLEGAASAPSVVTSTVEDYRLDLRNMGSRTAVNIYLACCWLLFALFLYQSAWFFPVTVVMFIILAINSLMNTIQTDAQAEPTTEKPVERSSAKPADDLSREGALYFLAMESRDGVAWKKIYADQIAQYNIRDSEVSEQRSRLIAAQHGAWIEVKRFAMSSFDKLDRNRDGFLSKEELVQACIAVSPNRREHALLSFLVSNLEDIQNVANSGERRTRGVSRHDLSEYFLHLENLEKEASHL
ncbi:MAG TPA: serine/threonine-protein kinase [Drouetiella sp.]